MKAMELFLWVLLLVIATSLTSCGILKRNSSSKDQWSNKQYNSKSLSSMEQEKNNNDIQYLAFNTDSASSAYRIKLWPKGKISFSNLNGFEGEFDSVLMQGSMGQLQTSSQLLNNRIQEQKARQLSSTDESAAEEQSSKSDKKSNPDYLVIGAIAVVLFITIYFVLKRIIF